MSQAKASKELMLYIMLILAHHLIGENPGRYNGQNEECNDDGNGDHGAWNLE
jgi:hypothetical protein